MIDDSRSFLSYTFSLLRISWQRKRRFLFSPPPTSRYYYYYYYFASERISRVFNTIKKKKNKFLTIIWKLIIRLLGEITRYRNIRSISSHITLKNEKMSNHFFCQSKIETFFVVDPRNGGFGTSCNRNERKCVSFEKRKEYIVFAIRDERGKEWGDDERRRDERGKERGVRTIEDHRSRIRSLLSILGCKWINRYIRCND